MGCKVGPPPNPNPNPNPSPSPSPSPSPNQGLKALREKGYLAEGAQPVCNFFLANDGKLDLGMIGDFLGSDSDECRAVCQLMIGRLGLVSTLTLTRTRTRTRTLTLTLTLTLT